MIQLKTVLNPTNAVQINDREIILLGSDGERLIFDEKRLWVDQWRNEKGIRLNFFTNQFSMIRTGTIAGLI